MLKRHSVETDLVAQLGDAPFRLLADHLPALCWMADPDGKVQWCNERWYAYTGVSADTKLTKAWLSVHDPAMIPEIDRRWTTAVASGQAGEMVVPLRGSDGRYRPFLTRAEPVRDRDGHVSCWLGTMTEISSQQEAEQNQRFLLTLGDTLRDETDPSAILAAVGEALARHLEVGRVGYGEVDPDREIVKAASRGWNDGTMPGRPGDYRLREFGDVIADALCRGETCAVADVLKDASTTRHADAFLALGIHALLSVPLVKRGRLAAVLYVHSAVPRGWRDSEIRLVEELAERTWATLDRARAEAERRESEERLRESEARQRAIVETTPECVKIVSCDGRLVYMNPAGLDMIEAEHLEHVDVADLVAPEHREQWRANHARVCAGESVTWEFDVIGMKGTRRRMETHAVPLPSPDGTIQQLAVTRDISDRRRAEERLRESEALLAAFMKHAPIGMYLKEADGRYLLANPEMAKVFERPVEEVIGRTAAELFGPDEAAMIAAFDREIVETSRPRAVEEVLPGRDSYAWSLVVRFPVSLTAEQPARIGGFDIDISDAKRAEAELARSREALYQSEKLSALGSLLAGVSHELNNPLSIILTHATLLEAKTAGTPHAERAGKIRNAAERCARIVQTFLAMARQKAPVRARVDANDIVRTALELTGYTLRTAGIEIFTRLAPDLPPLWADADQLTQVMVNLIVNAQHALEEQEGRRALHIRTSSHERTVRIEVVDNGPGVPPEIRRRIFEPFFTSKPQGVGTGIGLTLSLAIVEGHGGSIRLLDPPEGGACFAIDLPAVGDGQTAEERQHDPGKRFAACGAALVVDDEEDLGEALAELLEQEGFRVDRASSGREAQALLRERNYDVVLSDVRMPEMDGPALFDWIERERPKLVPCTAFVTGDTLGPAAGRFLARAGRPVLEKPFDAEGLRHVLAQLCPRATAPLRAAAGE